MKLHFDTPDGRMAVLADVAGRVFRVIAPNWTGQPARC